MSLGILDIIAVSLTAIVTALVFWSAKWAYGERIAKPIAKVPPVAGQATFLLEAADLIDSSPEGAAFLARRGEHGGDRDAVVAALEPMFPELGALLSADFSGTQILKTQFSTVVWLELRVVADRILVAICGNSSAMIGNLEPIQNAMDTAELNRLREITRSAPQLMWHTDPAGRLTWANDAYLATCDASADLTTNIPKLPSKPLFPELEQYVTMGRSTTRCSVKLREDDALHWFEITALRTDAGIQFYGSDADSIVRAELGQKTFVQTLSQTFAQLSIGLAIFDRRRQLATFNPALLDMTTLPFEFLSSRPDVDTLLDRLRELRMLPEPKNYASWREQFTAMEKAARDGTYSEHWNLPDGQTFKVTGRPHPDGAFALLFEDISAEISLTRRFRSEIETSQAVIDTISDAIAVFSNGGILVLANDAYCELWDTNLALGLSRYELPIELRKWQARCTPTRIWTNLREFTSQMGLRQAWSETAILDDGRQINCDAVPIKGGMTMIRFHFGKPDAPTLIKSNSPQNRVKAAKG